MRICAWPCGQAQTPLLLRPSYDEERRRSRRTEGRPLSLSVQFSTARNVQFSAGVDNTRKKTEGVEVSELRVDRAVVLSAGSTFAPFHLRPRIRRTSGRSIGSTPPHHSG